MIYNECREKQAATSPGSKARKPGGVSIHRQNKSERNYFTMSSTTSSKSQKMTEGNITRLLVMFALPLFVGNLFQQFYNTVDSIVV